MDPRRALFAACRRLGLDDDARHALLAALTGKASSKDLTAADWRRVLDHLNRLTGHTAAGPGRWREGCAALGAKVTALMADQGLPWRYLTHGAAGRPSMLRRLAGVDRLEFADAAGLRAIIAALSRRAEKRAEATGQPPD
jgi:phage gp16-like protein